MQKKNVRIIVSLLFLSLATQGLAQDSIKDSLKKAARFALICGEITTGTVLTAWSLSHGYKLAKTPFRDPLKVRSAKGALPWHHRALYAFAFGKTGIDLLRDGWRRLKPSYIEIHTLDDKKKVTINENGLEDDLEFMKNMKWEKK